MPDVLNIFLSYKMSKADEGSGEKIDIADEFAKELTDYTADKVKVHYAGNFEAGIDWRNEIINTIKQCDIFILLYTSSEQQWEFCLLEAGLFQATHPTRPLVVLHDPATPRPAALAQLNSVKMTVEHMIDFLSPIFYDEPWEISPSLRREKLVEIATDLVRVFHSAGATVTNFDLVPSFTLEMAASETTREQMRAGKLPENTKVRGTHDWQTLFDKGSAAQVLKWGDLTSWPVKKFYDAKFSRMALAAIKKDTPGGCFLRPSVHGKDGSLYRVALRRYEEYANETGWRFFFTAAPIDIPIFGIGDNNDTDEIRAYHLLNVCWYARRRLILVLAERAENYLDSPTVSSEELDTLVDEIKDELTNIEIQSFIRRIDQPRTLGRILPLEEIKRDQDKWVDVNKTVSTYGRSAGAKFADVVDTLRLVTVMNEKYYVASASAFNEAVNMRARPKA